jgi:hypothetical protein
MTSTNRTNVVEKGPVANDFLELIQHLGLFNDLDGDKFNAVQMKRPPRMAATLVIF